MALKVQITSSKKIFTNLRESYKLFYIKMIDNDKGVKKLAKSRFI